MILKKDNAHLDMLLAHSHKQVHCKHMYTRMHTSDDGQSLGHEVQVCELRYLPTCLYSFRG